MVAKTLIKTIMATYLITSREGLFIFDLTTKTFEKLRDGYFFGLTKHKETWYIFGYKGKGVSEKNYPTFQGYIASFTLSNESAINDWNEHVRNLDNGSHQLRAYAGHLYLVETYIQRILVFDILGDGSLQVKKQVPLYNTPYPIVNAHYVVNGNSTEYSCVGYKHINALTIHDDLIYLSCPSLRNNVTEDGRATQALSPHTIEVYNLEFEFLWSFTIPDDVFCHDIVFQGHTFLFNAPPNKVCSFDIVCKRVIHRKILSIESSHPRGLSVSRDGLIVVGLRKPGMLAVYNTDNETDVQYVRAPCEPCFIANTNYNDDYNNIDSHLVKPYVKQLHVKHLPIKLSEFEQISTRVFQHDWSMYTDMRWKQESKMNISTKIHDLDEVIKPNSEVFSDIMGLQRTTKQKIHFAQLEVIDGLHIEHKAILELLNEFEKQVQRRALRVSGHLYLYPPQSALGWHTNLEEPYNHNTVRCYIVSTTKNNESFFLYKHPISKLIHAVPDRNMFANMFSLGDPNSPLWHAVYNGSIDTTRLSLGIAFHQYRLGAFHVLKDIVDSVLH